LEALSYTARAPDERVTYLRIYADAEGETPTEEVDLALLPRAFFSGHPPLRLTGTPVATGWNICRVPGGMGVVDWHNLPRRELVIWPPVGVDFETSDGDIGWLGAGSIVQGKTGWQRSHLPASRRGSVGRPHRPLLEPSGPDFGGYVAYWSTQDLTITDVRQILTRPSSGRRRYSHHETFILAIIEAIQTPGKPPLQRQLQNLHNVRSRPNVMPICRAKKAASSLYLSA
jgi:hypothetical protein